MVSNKINEGVGKKIVEALKSQSEVDNFDVQDEFETQESSEIEYPGDMYQDNSDNLNYSDYSESVYEPQPMTFTTPLVQPSVQENETFAKDLEDFDVPANVAVLKQLINQLPTGVSKQTGAVIIKQTMEALGISMKSVLQEAQQVQDNLNNSSKECQASIMEHKKQIGILERQAQKFQRQSSALNDIISLFVQTNI